MPTCPQGTRPNRRLLGAYMLPMYAAYSLPTRAYSRSPKTLMTCPSENDIAAPYSRQGLLVRLGGLGQSRRPRVPTPTDRRTRATPVARPLPSDGIELALRLWCWSSSGRIACSCSAADAATKALKRQLWVRAADDVRGACSRMTALRSRVYTRWYGTVGGGVGRVLRVCCPSKQRNGSRRPSPEWPRK